MKLYDLYKEILSDNNRWNPTKKTEIDHDVDKIFIYPECYNYIFNLLAYDGNLRSLAIEMQHFFEHIPKCRLSHTISLYLLGISLAKRVGYSKIKLPYWDNDVNRNFLHHWCAICAFHDFGYCIEINKDIFPVEKYENIDDVVSKFNIDFDIREMANEKDRELLNNYYKYRTENKNIKGIDHGIVGAIILYNSLLKRNEKMRETAKTAIMICEKDLFGEENIRNIALYSMIIAKHNMWFANSENVELYEKYGLRDLIPKNDNSHRIKFDDNPILYMLCLLDTLEPIKVYENTNIKSIPFEIDFEILDNMVKITIIDTYKKVIQRLGDCQEWLDIIINIISECCIQICIQISQRN